MTAHDGGAQHANRSGACVHAAMSASAMCMHVNTLLWPAAVAPRRHPKSYTSHTRVHPMDDSPCTRRAQFADGRDVSLLPTRALAILGGCLAQADSADQTNMDQDLQKLEW